MNWKYILIVVFLTAIIGVGILVYQYQYWWVPKEEAKISETRPLEVKTSEEVPPEEIQRTKPPIGKSIGMKSMGLR